MVLIWRGLEGLRMKLGKVFVYMKTSQNRGSCVLLFNCSGNILIIFMVLGTNCPLSR